MKVNVNIDEEGIKVNETFTGTNAEEIVGAIKARVAKEVNFALRLMINSLSNVAFAQEVVKRYNTAKKIALPIPGSCNEFLELAQEQGFATVIEA